MASPLGEIKAAMPATFQSSGHFTLGYSQLGSNANVADGGIRKGKGGTGKAEAAPCAEIGKRKGEMLQLEKHRREGKSCGTGDVE